MNDWRIRFDSFSRFQDFVFDLGLYQSNAIVDLYFYFRYKKEKLHFLVLSLYSKVSTLKVRGVVGPSLLSACQTGGQTVSLTNPHSIFYLF